MKMKQCLNHKAKNKIHKSFTTHKEMLQDLGQLCNDFSLDNESYSIMHLFEEGSSIVLYTCTHSGLVNTLTYINHEVRLILGNDMVVI